MREFEFTKEHGLAIQEGQLNDWKLKLSAAIYSDLLAYVEEDNAKLSKDATGDDVFRGTDFDRFIGNWKP